MLMRSNNNHKKCSDHERKLTLVVFSNYTKIKKHENLELYGMGGIQQSLYILCNRVLPCLVITYYTAIVHIETSQRVQNGTIAIAEMGCIDYYNLRMLLNLCMQ